MSFCEKYNITIGIPEASSLLYTDDGKKMKGIIGKILQKFLNSRKNHLYKCEMITVADVGEKLQNDSYNGALGLIDKKEIDFYARAEVPFTDNQNVFFFISSLYRRVIVDTSQFIINEKTLFESPLKAAWVKGESSLAFVKNAPNNTFLKKLYLFKNENPIKIYDRKNHLNEYLLGRVKHHFMFMKSYTLHIITKLIASFTGKDAFLNEKPYYSTYSVFYIRKNLNKAKLKFVNEILQYSTEGGLLSVLLNQIISLKILEGPKNYKIYNTVKSYVVDNTKYDSLTNENFYFIFLIIYSFNFLILLIFISLVSKK